MTKTTNPRTAFPVRDIAVAATALVLALGAVACSSGHPAATTAAGGPGSAASGPGNAGSGSAGPGSTGSAAPGGAPAAPSNGSSAAGGSGTQPSAPAPGSPATDRCHTGDLKADVQIQPGGPGSAMVMLTNTGAHTCTVFGYLGYGGLLADNSKVVLSTSRVAHPGPPTRTTLKPGATAFSGLKWSSCDKGDPSCHVLGAIVVTPPDETTQLTATISGLNGRSVPQLTVSTAGFTVGSLQPASQGIILL
ncbi:hypothetical protein GCM10009760_33300 [Kitasatospora kazusensis]|uniref:DUF4232 domain-containing protein n=1 Tax=Kitasatospora kazusensis TaxID=407974 RepID=A0ABP5LCF0_9ACTN